jgi:O-antigen/teichoic acid export membrane protein
LFSQLANAALSSGFLVLVSHSLPQDQAGGLLESVALFSTATVIATCGADIGLMRMMPRYRRAGPPAVRRLLLVASLPTALVGAALAVGLYLATPAIAGLLVHNHLVRPRVVSELRLLLPMIPLAGLTASVLAGSRAWSVTPSITVQYLLVPALRPALFGAFLVQGATEFRATVAWGAPVLVGFLATLVVAASIARRASPLTAYPALSPKENVARWPFGEFWSFAGPRLFESALLVFLWGFDVVLVGSLTSPNLAASYAVATRYVSIATLALQAILVAIPTRISELMGSGARDQARDLYRVATWWCMAVAWPCALALATFSPFFMSLFGHGYRSGDTALIILSASALIGSSTGPSGAVLLMSGRTSVNLGITASAVGVNIPLMLVLAPRFGLLGAAVAATSSIAVMNVLLGSLLWRNFRMSPYGRTFVYVIVASVVSFGVTGLAVRLLIGASPLDFLLFCAVGFTAYGVFLYAGRRTLQLGSFLGMTRRSSVRDSGEIGPPADVSA